MKTIELWTVGMTEVQQRVIQVSADNVRNGGGAGRADMQYLEP
jgi:hypothetical protein